MTEFGKRIKQRNPNNTFKPGHNLSFLKDSLKKISDLGAGQPKIKMSKKKSVKLKSSQSQLYRLILHTTNLSTNSSRSQIYVTLALMDSPDSKRAFDGVGR